jgi:competence protein ComEC
MPLPLRTALARWRRSLREECDQLFASSPPTAGVLRAMLLGDRSFVDRNESADFQKTGVFHVLVVAGLHVGALAFSLFWLARKLKVSNLWATFLILGVVFSYVAVVEQRPPVLRAALMVAIVVIGQLFYRRLELLNSAALAALVLLIAKPTAVQDTSFQLSFAAIGCIAGLAVPWLERSVQSYVRALRGWRDVSRDAAHEPEQIQFRMDLRDFAGWVASRAPRRASGIAENVLASGIGLAFRTWELFVVSVVLQVGMLPLMARDFHRVPLSGALANLAAVPLTGVIVPAGFLTLGVGLVIPALGKVLAVPVAWLTLAMMHVVHWLAHFQAGSYRIPGPPFWLLAAFFFGVVVLAAACRSQSRFGARLASVSVGLLALSAMTVATYPFSPHRIAGQLEVSILDVGQGDSIFVVSPVGGTLLVDGGGAFQGFPGHEEHLGPDPGEDAVSPYLWSRGFKKVDVIALTHAHQDHAGGLIAILENFSVGRLWVSREVGAPALARLEETARRRNVPIDYEARGKSFEWGGVAGTLLWPDNSLNEVATTAKNIAKVASMRSRRVCASSSSFCVSTLIVQLDPTASDAPQVVPRIA